MIDTHCHLAQFPPEELADMLEGGFRHGLTAVVAPATGEGALAALLAIARRGPGRVFPAAGVHPERPMTEETLTEASRVAGWITTHRQEVVAIGEVGLPYYSLEPGEVIPETTFAVLDLLLDCAVACDLPVILHAVHTSARPCLDRLLAHGVRRAVFHWLKAPEDVVKQIAAAGYYVSVTPEVTTLARDQRLAALVPKDRLLLETDGPEPLRVPRQGASSPLWVEDSLRFLAERWHMSLPEAEALFDANARAFFQIA